MISHSTHNTPGKRAEGEPTPAPQQAHVVKAPANEPTLRDLTGPRVEGTDSELRLPTVAHISQHFSEIRALPWQLRSDPKIAERLAECRRFADRLARGEYDQSLNRSERQLDTLNAIVGDEAATRRGIGVALTYLEKRSNLLSEFEVLGPDSIVLKLQKLIQSKSCEDARHKDSEAFGFLTDTFLSLYLHAILPDVLTRKHAHEMARRFGPTTSPRVPAIAAGMITGSMAAGLMAMRYLDPLLEPGSLVGLAMPLAVGAAQFYALRRIVNSLTDRDCVPPELRAGYVLASTLAYGVANGVAPSFSGVVDNLMETEDAAFVTYATVLHGMKSAGELDTYIFDTVKDCRRRDGSRVYPALDEQWMELAKSRWEEMKPATAGANPIDNLILSTTLHHSLRTIEGLKARLELIGGLRDAVDKNFHENRCVEGVE